jgi:hypothetical protein
MEEDYYYHSSSLPGARRVERYREDWHQDGESQQEAKLTPTPTRISEQERDNEQRRGWPAHLDQTYHPHRKPEPISPAYWQSRRNEAVNSGRIGFQEPISYLSPSSSSCRPTLENLGHARYGVRGEGSRRRHGHSTVSSRANTAHLIPVRDAPDPAYEDERIASLRYLHSTPSNHQAVYDHNDVCPIHSRAHRIPAVRYDSRHSTLEHLTPNNDGTTYGFLRSVPLNLRRPESSQSNARSSRVRLTP